MKIVLLENGLMIEPETDFEEEYIRKYQGAEITGFVKTGASLSHVVGLKISKKAKVEEKPKDPTMA